MHLMLTFAAFLAAIAPTQWFEPDPAVPSPPFAAWIEAGEIDEINWYVDVRQPALRMDQRLEVVYSVRIRKKDLKPEEIDHDLTLWHFVTSREGELLTQSVPLRYVVASDVDEDIRFRLTQAVIVAPGEYDFWSVLYDQTTHRRSVERERIKVNPVDDELFPGVFADIPSAEFPTVVRPNGQLMSRVTGSLWMPLINRRPVDFEVISVLSTPEQWASSSRSGSLTPSAIRRYTNDVFGAMIALSELDLAVGRFSWSGLDLVRRQIVFDQQDGQTLDAPRLLNAFDAANAGTISVVDLTERRERPAFLRSFVEERIGAWSREASDPESPIQVVIFVSGSTEFPDAADLTPVASGETCGCIAYHFRMRRASWDRADDIDDVIASFDPRNFDIYGPRDFRKALGEIVEDLESYQ